MNKEDVYDLIKDAGYGVLATISGQKPKVRPLMPYLDDRGNLLIASFHSKNWVHQISQNPQIEICFIDRKMNFARVSGKAQVISNKGKLQMVWDNVPMLRQYFSSMDDPGLALIEIETEAAEVMAPQDQEPEIVSLK